MHKISDEFEFRSDRTTDYGVSCPWVSKKFPIDLQWENGVCMLAHSFLIKSSSKLLVTRTGIKARMSLISGLWFPWPIFMFLKWDLTFAHWTQVSDRCPLGYLFCQTYRVFNIAIFWPLLWINDGYAAYFVKSILSRPSIGSFKHFVDINFSKSIFQLAGVGGGGYEVSRTSCQVPFLALLSHRLIGELIV